MTEKLTKKAKKEYVQTEYVTTLFRVLTIFGFTLDQLCRYLHRVSKGSFHL